VQCSGMRMFVQVMSVVHRTRPTLASISTRFMHPFTQGLQTLTRHEKGFAQHMPIGWRTKTKQITGKP
jgi:hypothetical protein